MSHHRHSEESRLSVSITPAIADGQPWTARFIANNNLRQHCHLLARTFRGRYSPYNPIRERTARLLKVAEGKCCLLTAIHPSKYPAIPVLVRIASYADRWIRQPETWAGEKSADPSQILHSLLRHLFATWTVPKFFDNAWLVKGELIYLERDWFCHLASGGSMRTVQGMPPSITARALHLAMDAPCELTIRQALRWGQVKALGGSLELLGEVLRSRMVIDLSNDAIWSRLLEKLVAAHCFKPEHFGLIADTLLEMTLKDNCSRAEALVSLPLKDLIAHCRQFWRNILKWVHVEQPNWSRNNILCPHLRLELRHLNAGQWAKLPGSKTFEFTYQEGENFIPCRIQELTHQSQLVAESQAMKHCVDTYGRSCKLGRCSIFSVRADEMIGGQLTTTSHITIEVDRRSRRIIQVRGRRNRRIIPQQLPFLRKWANELELLF